MPLPPWAGLAVRLPSKLCAPLLAYARQCFCPAPTPHWPAALPPQAERMLVAAAVGYWACVTPLQLPADLSSLDPSQLVISLRIRDNGSGARLAGLRAVVLLGACGQGGAEWADGRAQGLGLEAGPARRSSRAAEQIPAPQQPQFPVRTW